MEKKHVVLLTVIAVATLLITVVGATFAFYSMTPTGAESAENVTVSSASGLTLTYNDGQTFTAQNVIPGWGEGVGASGNVKTVTVKNDSQAELSYDLEWKTINNSFTDKENFQYSLAVTTQGSDSGKTNSDVSTKNFTFKQVPEAGEKIVQGLHIYPGETQTYTFTFKYVNQNAAQGNPEGTDSFTGVLDVPENTITVYADNTVD